MLKTRKELITLRQACMAAAKHETRKILVCADGDVETLTQCFAHAGGHNKTALGVDTVMRFSHQFFRHSRLLLPHFWVVLGKTCHQGATSPHNSPPLILSISKPNGKCKYFFTTANH